MSECIPTFSISQERRGQVDDIGIVVIILSYLKQRKSRCISTKKNRNSKNNNRGNLNNLPQDKNAVLHSASPSHTVLHISLCLTTPVEEAGHDTKDPVQSRSSQLVPITTRLI